MTSRRIFMFVFPMQAPLRLSYRATVLWTSAPPYLSRVSTSTCNPRHDLWSAETRICPPNFLQMKSLYFLSLNNILICYRSPNGRDWDLNSVLLSPLNTHTLLHWRGRGKVGLSIGLWEFCPSLSIACLWRTSASWITSFRLVRFSPCPQAAAEEGAVLPHPFAFSKQGFSV